MITLVTCKSCGEQKTQVRHKSTKVRYLDASGKQWGSRIKCPDCHRAHARMTHKTSPKASYLRDLATTEFHPHMKCRQCDGQLPLSRYFHCYGCRRVGYEDLNTSFATREQIGFRISQMEMLAGGLI